MSSVTKPVGGGTFTYTLSTVPDAEPDMTIYSDALRTVVAQATVTTTATPNPSVFLCPYNAALTAGQYFLGFTFDVGGVPKADNNDTLLLVEASGSVSEGGRVCEPWVTSTDIVECAACATVDTGVLDEAAVVASEVLFELSGRQFSGTCTDTVRPCAQHTRSEGAFFQQLSTGSYIMADGSVWGGFCGCQLGPKCACRRFHEIELGAWPIQTISEVKVDGSALNPSLYQVMDNKWLMRLPDPDGSTPGWPCCQRLDLASTEADTFEVTFSYGVLPPASGRRAAVDLACQFALACTGGDGCQLSSRATSIVRQGVTIVLDSLAAIQQDLVGIPTVDLFLRSVNPFGYRGRAQVLTPDMMHRVRRVT